MGTSIIAAHPTPGGRASAFADERAWLAVTLLLAACLGLYRIGEPSLWTDELFSAFYVPLLGAGYALGQGLHLEPTPPTHALLVAAWEHLAGTSPVALRSLSLLAFLAGVVPTIMLGRELGGVRTGRAAGLLYATSPMAIYFAQETRVYVFMLAPTAVLLWSMARLLDQPRDRRAMAGYVVAGTMLVYLHSTAALLLAASGLAGAGAILTRPEDRWPRLWRWVAVNAAVAVAGLPWVVVMMSPSLSGGLASMGKMSWASVGSVLTSLGAGVLTPHIFPGLFICILLAAVLAATMQRAMPPARLLWVCLALPALFFLLACAASIQRSILLARILCWVVVPMAVLIGRQAVMAGRRGMILAAIAVVTSAIGLSYQWTAPHGGKEPWRQALAAAAPRMRVGDLAVAGPTGNLLPEYVYAPELTRLGVIADTSPLTAVTPINAALGGHPVALSDVQQRIERGERLWLVTNTFDRDWARRLKEAVRPDYDQSWDCGRGPCVEITGWLGRRVAGSP